MRCKDIMTKNPKCLSPTDNIEAAARQMRDEDIGSVIICEKQSGKLLGIVTDRDIVIKAIAKGANLNTQLDTIATKNPFCCSEEDDVDKAAELMEDHQVRRLPVTSANGRLVGIISIGDIATRAEEPEKAAEVVKEVSQPPTEQYKNEHAA